MLLALVTSTLLLAPLISASGEGNIHLLEEDIAAALKICASPSEKSAPSRQKRDNESTGGIDREGAIGGRYEHVRRVIGGRYEHVRRVNDAAGTEGGAAAGNKGGDSRLVNAVPGPAGRHRAKRLDLDPLRNKIGDDECLSQCVFANMQVVDGHGIPREAELWAMVQATVTSQQSRVALHDQIRACFQELQSEAEDDGCSYSNKLERCMTLRLAERRNSTAVARNS